MKKIIFLCLSILPLIGIYANAQQTNKTDNLPQEVSSIFHQQYPSAAVINCKKQNDGYTVKFRYEGKKQSAFYDLAGNWVETTGKIFLSHGLPRNVDNARKESKYGAWYIKSISAVQKPDSSYYVLDVDNSSLLDADHIPVSLRENKLYFDTNGKLIQKVRVE